MTLAVHSHFNNQHVWTGLSTDTKPSIGPNNPAGQSPTQNDLFYETDSGLTFVFANLAWKPFGDSSHVLIWQPSSLSWIRASADASGNLNVTLVSAATTSSNITQFGGTNISTGTGVSGAGIPRVTVSSDSFPATQAVSGTVTTTPPANASTNIAQVAGATLGATAVTNFGTAPAAAAVPGVNASIMSGTTALGAPNTFGTTAPTGNALGVNASLFVGTTVAAAAAAGVQKVGIVGNTGATLDAASGSATPTNGQLVGGGSVAGGTNFTALTVKAASTAAAATDTSLVVQPLVGNSVMSTAAAGVQRVGIAGSGNAVMDAVTTAATAPANGLAVLVENVTTAPSLTTGQSVMAQADYQGSLFVKPYRRGQTTRQATTISATGATAILAAGAAGIFNDLADLVITTAGLAVQTITISDGTLSWIIDYPNAILAPGTPLHIHFDPPLAATAAATAWTANQSLATTCHYLVNAVLQKAS